MTSRPLVQLRRIARFAYGDSLADTLRGPGAVTVFGSNGPVGTHSRANTRAPALVIGRKGSFGKVQFSTSPVFAIDTTFFVDSTQTDAHLRWLYYALGTLALDRLSDDVGVPGLSREAAYSERLPVPSLATQRAIADYLDRETARIDAVITAKQRMVELLKERESATFSGVLGRYGFRFPPSLDPEWTRLPRPEKWQVMHLSQSLIKLTNGYVGPTRDILREDGIPYIQSLHIKDGRINFDRGQYFVDKAWHRERPRIHLRSGDVLIVQTGDIGQVAVVPPGFGEASCHALQIARVRPNLLSGRYLAAYLRGGFGRQSLLSRATGALHPHLEAGILDIPVVVPPRAVQDEVVVRVEAENGRLAALQAVIGRQMSLLHEHRQALVTAAVTGEIDIRSAAA